MRKLLPLLALLAVPVASAQVVINEVDSDTPGADTAEFVELFNNGATAVDLAPYVLVFFNGSNDLSYFSIDLDGQTIQPGGFITIGNPGVNGVDVTFAPGASGLLQNGADAVALYLGSAATFPTGTAPTTANLVDAIVYDTADPDDTGLLTGLGETVQYDESAGGNSATESIQRFPDGSETIVTARTTPEATNLPVELVAFTAAADGAGVLLRWTTASETNNAGFSVETRANGAADWRAVGFEAGRGTTLEASSYAHRVAGLAAGRYSFRLRQTDFDGAASYSAEVEAEVGMAAPVALGVRGQREVRFAVREAQTVRVAVYNALGQRVANLFDGAAEAGAETVVGLEGAALPAGAYFVRLEGARVRATRSLVVR